MVKKRLPKITISMLRRREETQHPLSVALMQQIMTNGFPLGYDHQVQVEYLNGMSLVPWARCLSVACCLAGDCDYVLIADDDVWFRQEDVAHAIQQGLPIVSFPVMLKTENFREARVLNYSVYPDEPYVTDEEYRHVPRAGTGLMLVKAEVFLKLQQTRPRFEAVGFSAMRPEIPVQAHCYDYFPVGVRDIDGKQAYVGEDYGFCCEAASAGYPTFISGRSVTAHMVSNDHNGSYVCDMNALRQAAREGKVNEAERSAL